MELFKTIFTGSFTLGQFLIAVVCSIVLGLVVALFYMFKNSHSKSLALALVMISAIETVVIMMVNDNLGAGIAVAGSFSLIRFRSVKGNAKELACIFLAMAIGIMCGTGYVALAALFTLLMVLLGVVLSLVKFGDNNSSHQYLRITVPEDLNYDEAFNTVLKKYTSDYELLSVKTVDLGSLFKLEYGIDLKNNKNIKNMIDEIRTLNSNLPIYCGKQAGEKEEL